MVLLGVIVLVVAGVSATGATVMQCRANPHGSLPWVFAKKPPRSPWQANVLFGLAGGAGVLGGILLFGTLDFWAFLVMFGAWTVAFVIQYKHNRDVSRAPTTPWP